MLNFSKFKSLIIIGLFVFSFTSAFSYPFVNLPISEGNRIEDQVSTNLSLPNAKLAFIYTSPYISLSGLGQYTFQLEDSDTVKASFWIQSYLGSSDAVKSITFYELKTGGLKVMVWTIPMIEPIVGLKFSKDKPLTVTDSIYKVFITNAKAKSKIFEKINNIQDATIQTYATGAGFADTIDFRGTIVKGIDKSRAICFITFIDIETNELQFCYAYTDKPDEIYTDGTNSIKESIISKTEIYPNPAANIFTLSGELTETVNELTISICDLNGNLIKQICKTKYSSGKFNYSINTNDLLPGYYNVVIKADDKIQTEKLIISK